MEEPINCLSELEHEKKPNPPIKKRRGPSLTWTKQAVFPDLKSAQDEIKSRGKFRLNYKSNSSEGERHIYVCSYFKVRAPTQCPARLSLFLPSNSQTTHLDLAGSHDHESARGEDVTKSTGLSQQHRNLVIQFLNDGVSRPRKIINAFEERNLSPPSKTQLNNFLARLRKKEFGGSMLSEAVLRDWCSQKIKLPQDLTKPWSSEEEQEKKLSPPPKKRRGPFLTWTKEAVFPDLKSAQDEIKSRGKFRLDHKSNSLEGERHIYICSYFKVEAQCPAHLSLFLPSNSLITHLESAGCHDHESARGGDITKGGLSQQHCHLFIPLVNDGVSQPGKIINTFEKRNLTPPSKTQIDNILGCRRKKEFGGSTLSEAVMRDWCSQKIELSDDLVKPRLSEQGQRKKSSPPPKKRRGQALIWTREAVFPDLQSAQDEIKSRGKFRLNYKSNSFEGERHVYVCSYFKVRAPTQCPARLSLFLPSNSQITHLESAGGHDHESTRGEDVTKRTGLSQQHRNLIIQFLNDGVSQPRKIINAFEERSLSPPSKTQLNNFLARRRKKEVGGSTLSEATLRIWCSQKMELSEEFTEPNVVASGASVSPKAFEECDKIRAPCM